MSSEHFQRIVVTTNNKYSNEQIVIQIRLHGYQIETCGRRQSQRKHGTPALSEKRSTSSVLFASLSKHTPVVYCKESQHGEDFKSFDTRLKASAADCDFTCPHDESHCLIEYHLINKIRSGILDPVLQQEILQKLDRLNTLEKISAHCENY